MHGSLALLFVMLLSGAVPVCAQKYTAFRAMAFPHHAEAVRLGGMYTATGGGPAVAFFNPASLAFQRDVQLLYSVGRSAPLPLVSHEIASDAVISAHMPGWSTTIGLGYLRDDFTEARFNEAEYSQRDFGVRDERLSLHFATVISDGLAVGLTVHRYDSRISAYGSQRLITASSVRYDGSLSTHVRMGADFIGRPADELRSGITFDNTLASDVYYIDKAQADPIHQVIRVGAAYLWNPGQERVWGLDPFAALLSLESSLHGGEYRYDAWSQYGIGGEIRLFEILMLSAGWENLEWQASGYNDPAYPVLRWGFGLNLPVHRLWSGDTPVFLQFDYARTEWSSSTAEDDRWGYRELSSVDDPLWSLQLRAPLF